MANPQVVLVENLGYNFSPTQLRYDGDQYELPIGAPPKVIPYAAAVTWFGDPKARDIDARHRNRYQELKRMRTYWGLYHFGDVNEDFPKIKVTNVETGERIWTVVEDPEGEHLAPEDTDSTDAKNAREVERQLQGQIEELRAALAVLQTPESPTGNEDQLDAAPEELPADRPRTKVGVKSQGDDAA